MLREVGCQVRGLELVQRELFVEISELLEYAPPAVNMMSFWPNLSFGT